MSETVNQRIRKYRKLFNLTQRDMAERLEIKEATYSQMERKGTIAVDTVLKIAEILNIHPDNLIYENPAPNKNNGISEENPFGIPPQKRYTLSEPQIFGGNTEYHKPSISQKAKNAITILLNLPKPAQDEVIEFIHQKYLENK